MERRLAPRMLVAVLLVTLAVSAAAEAARDDVEAESLGPLWNPRLVTPGRVTVQTDVVRSGARIYFDDFRKERLAE